METVLRHIMQPDFYQQLIVATFVFALPLQKRKGWEWKFAIIAAAGLAVTVWFDSYINYYSEGNASGVIVNFGGSMEDSAQGVGMLAYYLIIMAMPIILSLIIFKWSVGLNYADSIFGTSIVYLTQHMAFCVCDACMGYDYEELWVSLGRWTIYFAVLAACYFLIIKYFSRDGSYHSTMRNALILFGVTLTLAMFLNYPARLIRYINPEVSIFINIYDILGCFFILLIMVEQRKESDLQNAMAMERQLHEQMRDQYELSKESIDIINAKCHDLKHQIKALKGIDNKAEREAAIEEMEDAVMIYDAAMKTGNTALDVVLTEKSLLCGSNNINWTCMADGSLLKFMNAVDIYTLFGNIYDNAIEASCRIPNEDMRVVSTTISADSGRTHIEVENYCDKMPAIMDGLPVTDKSDKMNHGYGMKSIKQIVEKYNGNLQISADDNIYRLEIMFEGTGN